MNEVGCEGKQPPYSPCRGRQSNNKSMVFLKLFGDLCTCCRCLPMKAVFLVWCVLYIGLWAAPLPGAADMEEWQEVRAVTEAPCFYQCMKLWCSEEAGEPVNCSALWSWCNIKRDPLLLSTQGASLRDSKGGSLPRVRDQLESLPLSRCGVLWVNGVWHRKGTVKGANLSLKWTFYRNPIFSGAQSQTDLVD